MPKSFIRKGAAVVVAALMVLSVGAVSAQTQGMERRDDRRDGGQEHTPPTTTPSQ